MNDSFRANMFVSYSPETIACACIYLAARKLKVYISFVYFIDNLYLIIVKIYIIMIKYFQQIISLIPIVSY